jgi:hypothetical protein
MSASADQKFKEACRLQAAKRTTEALEAFRSYLSSAPPRHRFVENAYAGILWCQSALSQWSEVIPLAEAVLSDFPDSAEVMYFLAQALLITGRRTEALEIAERAVHSNPGHLEFRTLLIIAKGQEGHSARPAPVRPWPRKNSNFEDPAALIRAYLLRDRIAERFISPTTRFLTMGSCFATELAMRLRGAGFLVHNEPIGEEINSTLANKALLSWVEGGPVDHATELMDQVYGADTKYRLRQALIEADVVVVTMGVAAAHFHNDSGKFGFVHPRSVLGANFLRENYSMRTLSVSENVDNVNSFIDIVRRVAGKKTKFVLTVSPVPMAATTEYRSAIVADVISKSTLRLACEQVCKARIDDNVLYWPSFEMVRWLGAHFGRDLPRVFGDQDDDSRHVSAWLVDLIVSTFLNEFRLEQ